jgi:hypothetical protein
MLGELAEDPSDPSGHLEIVFEATEEIRPGDAGRVILRLPADSIGF